MWGKKRKAHRFVIYHSVPYMSKRTGSVVGGAEFAVWLNFLAETTPEIIHSILHDFEMVRGEENVDISEDGTSVITYQTRD